MGVQFEASMEQSQFEASILCINWIAMNLQLKRVIVAMKNQRNKLFRFHALQHYRNLYASQFHLELNTGIVAMKNWRNFSCCVAIVLFLFYFCVNALAVSDFYFNFALVRFYAFFKKCRIIFFLRWWGFTHFLEKCRVTDAHSFPRTLSNPLRPFQSNWIVVKIWFLRKFHEPFQTL